MKKTLSLFLAFVLALGALPMRAQAADPVTYKDSGGGYKLSQLEIMQLMQDAPIYTPSNLFKTEPSVTAPYAPGELSDEALNAALARFNLMRTLAGLPEVTLDKTLCQNAQYGAVLLTQNYDHTPSKPANMDDDFYRKGYAVTSTSNIDGGSVNYNEITYAADRFMQDKETENLSTVGHRAWMMRPNLEKIGIGLARGHLNSDIFTEEKDFIVHVIQDSSGSGINYEFLAWPASGNFPRSIMTSDTPWSVALNPDLYTRPQASQVTITMKRISDNQTWTFSNTSADGYFTVSTHGSWENGGIIFRPDGITAYDGTYNVTISGIKTKSGQDTTLSYQVNFFNDVPGSYEIKLDDGTGETSSLFTNSAGKLTALPVPTRDGYTFSGWYTEPNGQGTRVQLATVFTKDSTIYAHWTVTGANTVKFNANGGTVNPETMTTTNYKLPSLPTPTRPGYTFQGWYTRQTGGSLVTTSTRFTLSTETVYAHWQAQQGAGKVTITLDLNAADATTTSSLTLQTDDKGRFTSYPDASKFKRPGYVLKGWGTTPTSGNDVLSSTVFTTDTTIYAQWVKSYGITLLPNLDGRTDTRTYYTDANGCCFDIPSLSHSKYTFLGWYTAPTGGTKVDMFTKYTTDTTLYAHWANPDGTAVPPAEQEPIEPVTPTTPTFTDVPANAKYADAVKWAYANGVTSGVSATKFEPNGTCDRAQVVTFLYNLAGKPDVSLAAGTGFGDVSPNAWYAKAVVWAKANKVTSGVSATEFDPNGTCTYEQVVALVYNYGRTLTPLGGQPGANWYDQAINWALDNGVATQGDILIGQPCPRWAIVQFMYNMNNFVNK